MSRRKSDVLYLLLRTGSLLRTEFNSSERRVVFRFRQVAHDETIAVAVELLDLDRLIRLFQAAWTDAKARGYLVDAITRTITTPGDKATS